MLNIVMKKACFYFVFCIFFLMMLFGFVEADNILTIKANVFAPVVSVDVSDNIFVGNVTKGYEIRSSGEFDIVNTGTTNISISAEIKDSDNATISEFIYFSRTTTSSKEKISNFNTILGRPSQIGGTTSDNFYVWFDLRNYNGEITNDMLGFTTGVRFVALPL